MCASWALTHASSGEVMHASHAVMYVSGGVMHVSGGVIYVLAWKILYVTRGYACFKGSHLSQR